MPCDRRRKINQTLDQRKQEIRDFVKMLSDRLVAGATRVIVGPTGAVKFTGIDQEMKDANMTDACTVLRIMSSGSTAAKMALQNAARLSGRPINMQSIGQGHHSHDGGQTWHTHKG